KITQHRRWLFEKHQVKIEIPSRFEAASIQVPRAKHEWPRPIGEPAGTSRRRLPWLKREYIRAGAATCAEALAGRFTVGATAPAGDLAKDGSEGAAQRITRFTWRKENGAVSAEMKSERPNEKIAPGNHTPTLSHA